MTLEYVLETCTMRVPVGVIRIDHTNSSADKIVCFIVVSHRPIFKYYLTAKDLIKLPYILFQYNRRKLRPSQNIMKDDERICDTRTIRQELGHSPNGVNLVSSFSMIFVLSSDPIHVRALCVEEPQLESISSGYTNNTIFQRALSHDLPLTIK